MIIFLVLIFRSITIGSIIVYENCFYKVYDIYLNINLIFNPTVIIRNENGTFIVTELDKIVNARKAKRYGYRVDYSDIPKNL